LQRSGLNTGLIIRSKQKPDAVLNQQSADVFGRENQMVTNNVFLVHTVCRETDNITSFQEWYFKSFGKYRSLTGKPLFLGKQHVQHIFIPSLKGDWGKK